MTTQLMTTSQRKEVLGYLYQNDQTQEEWALCALCVLEEPNVHDHLLAIINDENDAYEYLRCRDCGNPLAAIVYGEMQDLPYVDGEAYATGVGVCFIPEENECNTRYTRQDYLDLVNGSVARATHLFEYNTEFCDHVSPGTLIYEEEGDHCLFGEPGDDHYLPE